MTASPVVAVKSIDRHRWAIPPYHPIYEQAIARELNFWSYRRVMTDRERITYPVSHPLVTSYLNTLISGSPDVDWIDHILGKFKPKGRAASLGGGIGFYERRLLLGSQLSELDLYELCPANLDRASTRLDIPGRLVSYRSVDLNFAELPENHYDLIISRFFLHHIVNLEHLLHQIDRSLKQNGIFVLYDYVGESRYRWPEAKKKFINGLLDEMRPLGVTGLPLGSHPGNTLVAPDDPRYFSTLITNSPFETIRSADIPSVIGERFGISRVFEVRYGAILHSAFRCLDFEDWYRPGLQKALTIFVELDRVASAHDLFTPCGLFGIYGKAGREQPSCDRWEESRIEAELVP